jgi:hypothetical protein
LPERDFVIALLIAQQRAAPKALISPINNPLASQYFLC